jgi:ketosteroid isomerase-like protein
MLEMIAFVHAMDRCWIERRCDDLVDFLADDAVLVAPNGGPRLVGAAAAIASYREFTERCRVEHYRSEDHQVTERGDAAVLEYGWHMTWRDGEQNHQARGREILVLSRRHGRWRVIWRTQLAD